MDKDNAGNTITTYFISKMGNYVNRELNEAVDTYLWINDQYFVYSVYGVGIYSYNVIDGSKRALIEGNDSYQINSYKDGILKYDNSTEINIEF